MILLNYSNFTAGSTFSEGVLSDRQYLMAEGWLCIVRGLIALMGIVGNLLNIFTYVSLRPSDYMTTSFLVLAFSDMTYLVTMVSRAVSFGFYFLEKIYNMTIWFPVEPYGVYIFFGNAGSIPYTVSTLITAMIAVTRCISVWKPLDFKIIFRTRRSIYLLIAFVLFSAGSYIPILVFMGMTNQFVAAINTTRPTLWISPKREEVKVSVWAVRDAMLPVATQIIVFTCVLVMAHNLRRSLRFRLGQSLASKGQTGIKLSGKELQALRQVLFISLLYIVCNTPKVMVNFTPFFVHDFALGQPNQNMYLTSIGFLYLFQSISSSSTFLIYFKFSSKFRKRCLTCVQSCTLC